jgi:hypothetical protein
MEKEKKKSKGQIFKELKGYSKTRKNLMLKYNVNTLDEYREIARQNRLKKRELQKKRRAEVRLKRKEKVAKKK